jgi:hypothetical protein
MNEALWSRAVRAADARGLLPVKRESLTPRELAAQASLRGEERLARLVEGWYYPRSYGHVRGVLTDEEADNIVAAMEAESETASARIARAERAAPLSEPPAKPRVSYCDLCGRPVIPTSAGALR